LSAGIGGIDYAQSAVPKDAPTIRVYPYSFRVWPSVRNDGNHTAHNVLGGLYNRKRLGKIKQPCYSAHELRTLQNGIVTDTEYKQNWEAQKSLVIKKS
jgi:hypothetical protein